MKKKDEIIQKMVASMLLFVMFITQSAIVGITAISYAIDMIATNSDNVEFMAYFEENGEKVTSIERSIEETAKLKLYVAVRNEGYLQGQISLEDAGFKIKEDSINENGYIEKVENNIIFLKQINAEEVVNIELDVQRIDDSLIRPESLNNETKVKLLGTYYNSKRNVQIDGEGLARINWKLPQDIKAELASKLLTNAIYNVNEQNKRVVELLVSSRIENNRYPIKNTHIEIDIPEEAEKVEVHKRTTSGTNGNKDFLENNYTVNNNKLTIDVSNEVINERISWIKNSTDVYVVTIELPEETDINNREIKINSQIKMYDDQETIIEGQEQTVIINEEIEGIVSTNQYEVEREIYKGKLYAGEERDYISYTRAYVDYAKAIEGITINEKETTYVRNDEELPANIEYRKVTVNKNNIVSILGQEWNITITDQNNVEKTITNETEINENGNIDVELESGAKELKIKTSKVINNGKIEIQNTKAILKTEYTREELSQMTGINNKVLITYTRNNNETETPINVSKIELKETETKATLNLSTTSFSTLNTNENVEVTAKLETGDEKLNLYKNPEIDIVFPKEVNNIKVLQAKALYRNGLEVESNKLYRKEDGRLALYVNFKGEQTNYDTNGGTELHLYLNVDVNDLIPTQVSQVEMNYTNGDNKLATSKEITLSSKYGALLYSELSNYNSKDEKVITKDKTIETAKIERNKETKEAILHTAIINNYDKDMTNIVLTTKIPSKNEKDTFSTTLKSIEAGENAKIYYSKNSNAEVNDTSWSESIEGAKKAKIIIDKIQPKQVVKIQKNIILPEKLDYNQVGYLTTDVTYIYDGKTQNDSSNIMLKTDESLQRLQNTPMLRAPIATGVEAEIKAVRGGTELNDGDNVYEGETIKYTITIKNNSGTDYTNINVKATQTNGKVWKWVSYAVHDVNENPLEPEDFYEPTNDTLIDLGKIDELKNGQSITLKYEATVDLIQENETKKTYGTINITSEDGNLDNTIKTVENNIENAELKLELKECASKQNKWTDRGIIKDKITILNLTENVLNDVELKIVIPNKLTYDNFEDLPLDLRDYQDIITVKDKQKNENGETIVNLNISKIEGGQSISIYDMPFVKKLTNDEETIQIMTIATTQSKNVYYSNEIERTIYRFGTELEINQKAYVSGTEINSNTEVKEGEEVEFVLNIINIDSKDTTISISDGLPAGIEFISATLSNENEQKNVLENVEENVLYVETSVKSGKTATLKIKAKIITDKLADNKFDNKVTIIDLLTRELRTSNFTILTDKVISAEYDENEDTEKNNETDDDNKQSGDDKNNTQQNEPITEYTINGSAWIDKNKDGVKDSSENMVENLDIKVINAENGNQMNISTKTDSNGKYSLSVPKGKYIIVFLYDTEKYILTTYQSQGVEESLNSDVISKNMTVDNKTQLVGATDELDVQKDMTNIDIGLVYKDEFDFKIEKFVSKVTVTNKNGVETEEFSNDNKLPKVEIKGKYLSNTSVVVEYTFRIINIGDVAGYVTKIEDKLPSGVKFESNLNANWYVKDNKLYNEELLAEKIEPGKEKQIKLVVTKKMTASNTGLFRNTVNITDTKNDENMNDINKDNDEDTADLIITVSTGESIKFISLTIAITILIFIGSNIIIKKYVKS